MTRMNPCAPRSAWIVAMAITVAVGATSVAPAQSSGDAGKKKGGASWKIPPSAPAPKAAPADADPAAKPAAAPDAVRESSAALGDAARLARLERAKEGQDGPWNEGIQLYLSSPTTALTPVVHFGGASSPSVVTLADSCLCFFVQYPVDDPGEFARLVFSLGTDGATNWTHPRAVILDQMPANIEGPLHPSVAKGDGAEMTLCFLGRTADADLPHTLLMSARSTDQGATWTVSSSRLDLGVLEVIDLSCVSQGKATHALFAVKGEPGLRHAARPSSDAAFEHKAAVRLATPGYWRGGCALADAASVEFWGAGDAGGPLWRARSTGALADWKCVAPDATATPIIPDDAGAIDIATTVLGSGESRVSAAVLFEARSQPTAPEQAPDAAPEAPPSGEGHGLETAPTGRRISDPVASPRGLEAKPLGGKRPPPAPPVQGPTVPPLGGQP